MTRVSVVGRTKLECPGLFLLARVQYRYVLPYRSLILPRLLLFVNLVFAAVLSSLDETGPPSEEHCCSDIEASYKFLRNNLKIPARNIVLYGRSLGSGPSCNLAAGTACESREDEEKEPVGGLILHAPFLSVYRIVVDTGCTVYGDKFPNVDLCPMINSPSIVIHGTEDQIVPFYHSEQLHQAIPPACRAKPLFIQGMGHNNVHSAVRPHFVECLNEYLDEHVWPNVDQSKHKKPSPPSSSLLRREKKTKLAMKKRYSSRPSSHETLAVTGT